MLKAPRILGFNGRYAPVMFDNAIDQLDMALRNVELAWVDCSQEWRDRHALSFLENVHRPAVTEAKQLRQLLLDLSAHEYELQRAAESYDE